MFEYWAECAPCDECGKDIWGIEFWNEEMKKAEVTSQLCKECLEKLASECI